MARQRSAATTAATATAGKLATHEAICAERYAGILSRIGRLEALIVAAAGSVIAGLVVAVWTLAHLGVK